MHWHTGSTGCAAQDPWEPVAASGRDYSISVFLFLRCQPQMVLHTQCIQAPHQHCICSSRRLHTDYISYTSHRDPNLALTSADTMGDTPSLLVDWVYIDHALCLCRLWDLRNTNKEVDRLNTSARYLPRIENPDQTELRIAHRLFLRSLTTCVSQQMQPVHVESRASTLS